MSLLIEPHSWEQNLVFPTTSCRLRIVKLQLRNLDPFGAVGASSYIFISDKHGEHNTVSIGRASKAPHKASLNTDGGFAHPNLQSVNEGTGTYNISPTMGTTKHYLIVSQTSTDTAKKAKTENCTCKYTVDKIVKPIGLGSDKKDVIRWYGYNAKGNTVKPSEHMSQRLTNAIGHVKRNR